MTDDLLKLAAQAQDSADPDRPLPPVERWNPAYCGPSDIAIRRDGVWTYRGSPIGRAALVRLFSTVLKREGDEIFLVTPVEKLSVEVEDAPFLAVAMTHEGEGRAAQLSFTTNVGDVARAGPGHEIVMRKGDGDPAPAPYIHVRGGLEAKIARAVFYDLVALAQTQKIDGREVAGVWSGGEFFPLGPIEGPVADSNG